MLFLNFAANNKRKIQIAQQKCVFWIDRSMLHNAKSDPFNFPGRLFES